MMEEKKYKYSNYHFGWHWDGSQRYAVMGWKVTNDKVSALRLLRMTIGLGYYEISGVALVPLEIKTIVDVYSALSSGDYSINEYMQKVVNVSGVNGLDVTVDSYPTMTYMYPYEHGEWVYPVILVPGAGLVFTVKLFPTVLLSSNAWSFVNVVMIFEDA